MDRPHAVRTDERRNVVRRTGQRSVQRAVQGAVVAVHAVRSHVGPVEVSVAVRPVQAAVAVRWSRQRAVQP